MPDWSYVRSTDRNGVSHRQNIPSCINIPIVMDIAARAIPLTDTQWQLFNNVTAAATSFRTRKPSINLNQISTIPSGFVFQLPHKFSPASITIWVAGSRDAEKVKKILTQNLNFKTQSALFPTLQLTVENGDC